MTVPDILYQRALDEGFTVEAACALLANVQGESAFRADNAEDRVNRVIGDEDYIRCADAGMQTYNGKNFIYDEVGFGYAQWTFWSRKKALYEFCKNRGVSVADHEAQKEFIFVEMKRDFPAIYELCKTSHDLDKLMHDLIWIWENPRDKNGALSIRYPYARAWYAKYNVWSAPVTPVQTESDPEPKQEEKTWPPRTINSGLNWPETWLLQALLKCHGYNVIVNGIFGSDLTTKTKEFQYANFLDADGVVGPMTWKKLLELPTNK